MEDLLEQAVVGASSWSRSGYPGKANPRNDLQPPFVCVSFIMGMGKEWEGVENLMRRLETQNI